jgi:hypothetical protein
VIASFALLCERVRVYSADELLIIDGAVMRGLSLLLFLLWAGTGDAIAEACGTAKRKGSTPSINA